MPTLDLTITAAGDDGFSTTAGAGTFNNTDPEVTIGEQMGVPQNGAFLRFLNVTIPQGSVVNVAYLTYVETAPDGVDPATSFRSNFFGNDADNAAAPTSYSTHLAKVRTAAFAAYDDLSGALTAGVAYNTPSLVAPIQAVIDRLGWVSGNALMLLWDAGPAPSYNSRATNPASYEHATYNAPILHIEYDAPVVVPPPAVASAPTPGVMPTTDRVAHPRNAGYGARLDELLMRLAITPESQVEVEVVEAQAPRIQLGGAFAAIPEATMVVSVGDASGGEGLFSTSKAKTELDQRRFYASRGIDTSAAGGGEPDGFTLLHGTEVALADVSATTPYMVVLGQAAFYTDVGDVINVASPLAGASPTTEDPFIASAAAVTGLAKIGGELFASMNAAAGISKRSVAGSWAVIGTIANVYGLWSAKGVLFAGHDSVLDIVNTTTGAPTTLLTLPPGATVTAIADAGDAVLVADSTGSVRSYALDGTAALALFSESRVGVSSNEQVSCLGAGFGVVMVGTKEVTSASGTFGRLYSAELAAQDGNFRLVNIQLVREFDSEALNELRHPTAIAFKKTSAYIAVTANGEAQLWRYQLSTKGLSQDLVFPTEAAIYGLGVFEDRFVVAQAAVGLWRETANHLVEGYLITSMSDFGFATEKNWAWINFLGSNLGSGNSVEVSITSSHAAMDNPLDVDWIPILTVYDQAGLGSLAPIFNVEERETALKITLRSGGGATAPRATAVSLYAYPVTDELRIRLPVNVSDRLERHGRRPLTISGYGNYYYRELLARRGVSGELELYRQGLRIRGVVENVQMARAGTGKRGSGMLVAFVTFKGRVLTLGGTTTVGPSTMGVGGTLGIEFTLGV